MWEPDYFNYGAIKIQSSEVWVYKSQWSYTRVTCPREVQHAYWAGSFLIVVLDNGITRRYRNNMIYEVVC